MILQNINLEIKNYLNLIKRDWYTTSTQIPDFLKVIPYEIKKQNELYMDQTTKRIHSHIKAYPRTPWGKRKWKRKMFTYIEEILFGENVFQIHQAMKNESLKTYQREVEEFLRHVRCFAPELSFEDTGQALRNYLVYIMFKELNQIKSGFSKACFGYSMLYPITDNYIDSMDFSPIDKESYNQMIRDKIKGNDVSFTSIHQKQTCNLLQLIEEEYPRTNDETIYTLLLMMLEAQEYSIRQQNRNITLSLDDRLDISIYKGGISVFIDRFFINKEFTEQDYMFYLGLGFFLQLADDLQDIQSDYQAGNQTIFTVELNNQQEEKIVNQMLHFIHNVVSAYQTENVVFKDFVLTNCFQLVFTSLTQNKVYFSPEYINRLEKYLPFTYEYYENFRKDMPDINDVNTSKSYVELFDELLK